MASSICQSELFRIIFLCVLWYIVSSSNNIIGKIVLNRFSYPITLTMVQLLSISLYSGPMLSWLKIRRTTEFSFSYYRKLILPLAFGKFLASVSSHVSLWKVPVSYAHTVKATMPLFTVLLTRIIQDEKQSCKVYTSLVPILLGVAIATITELSFDLIGLFAALLSTCGFSLLHIFSKKVMQDTGVHHLHLLHLLGKFALFMFFPVWLLSDCFDVIADLKLSVDVLELLTLLFADGALNWLQNIIAFTILSHVTPLTYAVANTTKRISVIIVSLVMLKNPVTFPNVVGMFLAVVGVLGYNKAKYDDYRNRKLTAILPITNGSIKPLNGLSNVSSLHPPYAFNYSKSTSALNGLPNLPIANGYARVFPNVETEQNSFHLPSQNGSLTKLQDVGTSELV